jgi:hypothetical protein
MEVDPELLGVKPKNSSRFPLLPPPAKTIAKRRHKLRKRRRRKRQPRLPQELFAIPNADKKFHEKWGKGRDPLNFPHPFRMILASKPNGGKTSYIKHVIMRVRQGRKPFEKIYVVHCDGMNTKEYNDIGITGFLPEIPEPEAFESDKKTLVILEDLNYLDMDRQQRGLLERLFGYVSTHKNISVMSTAQNAFNIIPAARRCANVWVVWDNHDQDMIKTLGRKLSLPDQRLADMFRLKCKDNHDNITIDFTENSPYPFRKNGFELFDMYPPKPGEVPEPVSDPNRPPMLSL